MMSIGIRQLLLEFLEPRPAFVVDDGERDGAGDEQPASSATSRLSDHEPARGQSARGPAGSHRPTSRCARIERPDCSMNRPSRSINGSVSRRRSSGERSRRYFCRSSDATSLSASKAPISRSLRFSSLCIRASEPKAGTNKACESRNTAPPSNARKTTSPPVMTVSYRLPEAGENSSTGRSMPRRARRRWNPGTTPVALRLAEHVAFLVHSGPLEREDLRHGDDIALHAVDLLHADHAPAAILVPRNLEHDVDRGGHLRPQRPHRDRDSGHRDHRLDAAERVARRVGVDRRQRAVVPGVHGLQHVERLGAAHLAHDDAVRPHAQSVAHQVALRHLALALDVRRPRLEPHDVRLLQLQLRRVLDGDDALRCAARTPRVCSAASSCRCLCRRKSRRSGAPCTIAVQHPATAVRRSSRAGSGRRSTTARCRTAGSTASGRRAPAAG